jgi:hypothetical protein
MTVEEAVKTSIQYVGKLFEGSHDLRLEEVELADDEVWRITVSFLDAETPKGAYKPADGTVASKFRLTIGVDSSRTFKVVELAPNGHVKAVKIRPIVVG